MQENENYEFDPNFAVVCSFLERFGKYFGDDYAHLKFKDFKHFLEATEVDVNNVFVRLHKKLARGIGEVPKNSEKWYKVIIKFCKDFPDGDNLLIKEKGYENIPIKAKLRILKNLCEDQFEYNDHFNKLVNEQLEAGTNLRHEPVGRDRFGRSYWFMLDKSGSLRLFRRWWNGVTEYESWNIVSSDVDELERLIGVLEDDESTKPEDDPPVVKGCDLAPSDVLSTAADDAANMVYFSGKDFPPIHKPRKRRTKAQIIAEERKYKLPHCRVRVQRLPEEQLKKYTKQLTQKETSDNPDSNEIKSEGKHKADCKPVPAGDKKDVEQANATSNCSMKSPNDNRLPEIKDEPESPDTNNQSSVEACNDVKTLVKTNSDNIKKEIESDSEKNQLNRHDIKDDEVGKKETKQVPLANSKGDACSKQENTCNSVEMKKKDIGVSSATGYQIESRAQKPDLDNEKKLFDHAIKDLLMLDGKTVKDESLQINKPLLNGTTKEGNVINETQKCLNEAKVFDKQVNEGLSGVDQVHCKDTNPKIDDNVLKDLSQVEAQKALCNLNVSQRDDSTTSPKSSEITKAATAVSINNTARPSHDKKPVVISSSECISSETHSEVIAEIKEKVKDEIVNKENKVIENNGKNDSKNANCTHTDSIIKGKEEKDTDKTDRKKAMSMKVGDEIIQIEEVSSDSGDSTEEESKSEKCGKNGNSVSSLSKQDNMGKVIEDNLSISKEPGKALNKAESKGNNLLNSDILMMKCSRQPPVTVSKVEPVFVQASKPVTMSTSGNNLVYLTAGSTLQKTLNTKTPAQIALPQYQTNLSSVSDIKTIFVPVDSSKILNALPSSQPQSQILSILNRPVVSIANSSSPFLRNPGAIRSILHNKITASTSPNIILAPPVQAPTVITLQKSLGSMSSQVLQSQPGIVLTTFSKPVSTCNISVNNTNVNPPTRFVIVEKQPSQVLTIPVSNCAINAKNPIVSSTARGLVVQKQPVNVIAVPVSNSDITSKNTNIRSTVSARGLVVHTQTGNILTNPVPNRDTTVKNTNVQLHVNNGNIPTVVGDFEVKKPNVSVKDVTIVIGKDGIHYDKATGQPYKYPADQRYVVAGPRGKFYDKETGYEVDVPQSGNMKHVPGTIYLASGVSFTKEVQEKMLKMKKKKGSNTKKCKKNKNAPAQATSSDEEFAKMLESEMEKSSEEESIDEDYDYEKISERVRSANNRKLPARRPHENTDIEDDEDIESDSEQVPLVLGRNAKRAAAAKMMTNISDISEGESDDDDDDSSKLCSACDDQDKPSLVLLCDECGNGYHMSCLLPPLLLVPLEDWYCPKCEHNDLIKNLREKLKAVKKAERAFKNKVSDRITLKAFSIDEENIVEHEKRSCRQRKEVNYNDASYDKMFKNVFKEVNSVEKRTRPVYSSDSDDEMTTRSKGKKVKTKKRSMDRSEKSRGLKKPLISGQSKAKKRRFTSLYYESDGSDSDYKQTEESESSETDVPSSKSENVPENELYYTSSGRQTKHISYKIT